MKLICETARTDFRYGVLFFVGACIVAASLQSQAASDQFVPAKRVVYTYRDSNANADKEFPSADAACRAYVKYASPGSTFTGFDDYKPGDSSVRCLWKTKDGDKDGFTGVQARVDCLENSNSQRSDSIKTSKCECDSDLVASKGKCVTAEQASAASAQGGAETSAAADTKEKNNCPAQTQARPQPGESKKQSSAKQMPEHKVECFDTTALGQDQKKLKEMAAQLRRQQEGLNALTVDEFQRGMYWYADKRQEGSGAPRKGEEKKQKEMRQAYKDKIAQSMRTSLQCSGLSDAEIDKRIKTEVPKIMKDLHALHEPDVNVTGGEVTRLGDAQVNRLIGQQWVKADKFYDEDSRRYRLLAAAMAAEQELGPDAKLNVVLEPCR